MLVLALLAGLPLTFNADPGTSEGDRYAAAVHADLCGDWLTRINPAALHSMGDLQRLDGHFTVLRFCQRQQAVNKRLTVSVLRTDRYPHPAYCVGNPERDQWHALPEDQRHAAGVWLRFAEWVVDDQRHAERVVEWERKQAEYMSKVLNQHDGHEKVECEVKRHLCKQGEYYPPGVGVPIQYIDNGCMVWVFGECIPLAELGLYPPAVALKSQPPRQTVCPLYVPGVE